METVLLRAPFVGIAVTAPVSRSTHPSDPMDREFIDPLKAILIYHPVLLVHASYHRCQRLKPRPPVSDARPPMSRPSKEDPGNIANRCCWVHLGPLQKCVVPYFVVGASLLAVTTSCRVKHRSSRFRLLDSFRM